MKKLILLLLSIFMVSIASASFAANKINLRDYSGIEIPAGTFVPVINTQEISTAYLEEGSKVKFIATSDLYLYETNIIPRESQFLGYIEKINEPVVGTNSSMIIRINKLILPDGFEIPLWGYIYSSNKNLIGGELTPPLKYDKMPHYQKGLSYGTLQYVPGAVRMMGSHTVIAAGADLMVVLVKPIEITHTLTN